MLNIQCFASKYKLPLKCKLLIIKEFLFSAVEVFKNRQTAIYQTFGRDRQEVFHGYPPKYPWAARGLS